jgi:hypothetical protein
LVAVLAVLLVASSLSFASAQIAAATITIVKLTTNGDTTTPFNFAIFPGTSKYTMLNFDLRGGETEETELAVPGDWRVQESIPSGWVLEGIVCGLTGATSTWEIDIGNAQVIIHIAKEEWVVCTFTNAPGPAVPVGGFVEPVNKLAVAAPYLALFGIVAAAVAVVVWKKPDN